MSEVLNSSRRWSEEQIRELLSEVRSCKKSKQGVAWGLISKKYGRTERGCQTTWQRYRNHIRFSTEPTK